MFFSSNLTSNLIGQFEKESKLSKTSFKLTNLSKPSILTLIIKKQFSLLLLTNLFPNNSINFLYYYF